MSDFNNGWEDGYHDRVRDLDYPGNLDDFSTQYKKGYKSARRSDQKRPPHRAMKKRDEQADDE